MNRRDIDARLDRLGAHARARRRQKQAPAFVDHDFPEQAAYIEDPAKLKVVLCPRRAGKSYGDGLYLFKEAWEPPLGDTLYLGVTGGSAKRIMWEKILKPINRALNLEAIPNETEHFMRLPMGSFVYLLGADSTEEEKRKLLGGKYKLIIVDEGGEFKTDLNKLLFNTLKPMVADFNGTLCLTGFPGNVKHGLFYELTKDQDPQSPGTFSIVGGRPAMKWSGHRWHTECNPYMREQWCQEIAELKANNPRIEETPGFQQNMLGRWFIDTEKLVYRYQEGRNDFDGTLPKYDTGTWHYVLGVDLGWHATAFSLKAFHDHDRRLYVLQAWKKKGLDITATANEVKRYEREFPLERTIVDGANKQAVQEMNQRHGTSLVPADKRDKFEFIDLMNDDFIQGYILLGPKCEDLKDEYAKLVIDERKLELTGKREELRGCANHDADATLYGWRDCYQYLSVPTEPPPPRPGTLEFAEQLNQEIHNDVVERLEQRRRLEAGEPHWDTIEPRWDSSWAGWPQ